MLSACQQIMKSWNDFRDCFMTIFQFDAEIKIETACFDCNEFVVGKMTVFVE